MRDLLFRGKKVKPSVFDKTDWVYGSLIDSGNHEQVAIYPWYDGASTMSVRQLVYTRMEGVKPETIGQFTGVTDKNGNKVFEHDIVRFDRGTFVVVFSDCRMGFCFDGLHGRGCVPGFTMSHWEHLEVIGNIHDDKELLAEKGKTNEL